MVFISCHIHFDFSMLSLMNKKVETYEKSWVNFALHYRYLLWYCNSFFNVLFFLKMNKSQNLKMQLFFRIPRVRLQDPLRCCCQNQQVVSWKYWRLKINNQVQKFCPRFKELVLPWDWMVTKFFSKIFRVSVLISCHVHRDFRILSFHAQGSREK